MKTYRLKDNHPVVQKVDAIFQLAQELGISFRYSRAGYMMVDQGDNSFYLNDMHTNNPVESIPAITEYTLTYEK